MRLSALVALFLLVALPCIYASSHSEAPGTAKIPNADITDFYMFMSYETGRTGFVTFLLNVYPLQTPGGGPNYFTLSDAHYFEVYIDNNGDLLEDITFQFYTGNGYAGTTNVTLQQYPNQICLTDPAPAANVSLPAPVTLNISGVQVAIPLKIYGVVGPSNPTTGPVTGLNWLEWYFLNQIFGDRDTGTVVPIPNPSNPSGRYFKPFDYAGQKAFGSAATYENYARSYIYNITINGPTNTPCAQQARIFVGQRAEAFNINLGRIFDLVNFVPVPGAPNAIAQCDSNNDLIDKNVDTFALEVHTSCLLPAGDTVIGSWASTRQLIEFPNGTHGVGLQVSRMGNPLVNELVIGLPDKGNFNRQKPTGDGQFANYVFYPTLPAIIDLLFRPAGTNTPYYPTNFPRMDLVTVFLTGFNGFNKPSAAGTGYVGELLRLNTTFVTDPNNNNQFGVIAGDFAGFPNGRRPFDDVVDIALQVVAGKVCYLVDTAFSGFASQLQCNSSNAAIGSVNLTDGAPLNYSYVNPYFPYLRTPNPGSVTDNQATLCKTTTASYVNSGGSTTTTGGSTTTTTGSHSSAASTLKPFNFFFEFFAPISDWQT